MTNTNKHDNWLFEVTPTEISSKTSLLTKKHHWLRPICTSRNAKKLWSHLEICTSKDNINKIAQHLGGKGRYKGRDSARERVRSSLTLRSLRLDLDLERSTCVIRPPQYWVYINNLSVASSYLFCVKGQQFWKVNN